MPIRPQDVRLTEQFLGNTPTMGYVPTRSPSGLPVMPGMTGFLRTPQGQSAMMEILGQRKRTPQAGNPIGQFINPGR